MDQFTLRIADQTFDITTTSGSVRLKVLASDGAEFYFDPKSQKYFDSRGSVCYSPQANGIDTETLSRLLLDIDSERREELQRMNTKPVAPVHCAVLFDNGDFCYYAYLKPVMSPERGFAFYLTSQWRSALNPQEEQFRFKACLEREGLKQLRDLIERALSK